MAITESDRVYCPFYHKIGACRHGDRCSRAHNKPSNSQTVLFKNMYVPLSQSVQPGQTQPSEDEVRRTFCAPLPLRPWPLTHRVSLSRARSLARSLFAQVMDHFEDFYEDVFEELVKFGELRSLNVCDNEAFHLAGNVYAVFRDEDAAAKALEAMNGRYYAGKPIIAEFSPVTEFREAVCRQYDERGCTRGGNCNFMHLKRIGRSLRDQLFGSRRGRSPDRHRTSTATGSGRRNHSRSRSRSRSQSPGGRARYTRDDKHARDRSKRSGDESKEGEETDEERRAKIARWNRERQEKMRLGEKLKAQLAQ